MGWFADIVQRVHVILPHGSSEPPPAAPAPAGSLPAGSLPAGSLPAGPFGSVEDVIAQLEQIGEHLSASDGVTAFNVMYLHVTQQICEKIHAGFFANPAFMERLDVIFAGLYITAATAPSGTEARCWAPLIECRDDTGCLPIQFAVAGMNAHINHDLPLALVTTCNQLGLALDGPGLRADYNRVMDVLSAMQQQVRESFLSGIALDVDHDLSPVANLVGSWSIGQARDAAWTTAEVLWRLNGEGPLRADFLAGLDRSVGLAGRCMLVPVSLVPVSLVPVSLVPVSPVPVPGAAGPAGPAGLPAQP